MTDASPPDQSEETNPAAPPGSEEIKPSEADNPAASTPLATILSIFSTLITILIAVQQLRIQTAQADAAIEQEAMKTQLAAISREQNALNLRVSKEKQTTEFVTFMLDRVEKMNITDEAKKRSILISLLDLVAESRAGETGETSGDNKEDIRLFAIRLALLSDNHDAIAHVGYDRVDEWLPLAKKSSYPDVRVTAIRALGQLALFQDAQWSSQPQGQRLQDNVNWLFRILNEIVTLARGLKSKDRVTKAAIEEIQKIQANLVAKEDLTLTQEQYLYLDFLQDRLREVSKRQDLGTASKKVDKSLEDISQIQQTAKPIEPSAAPSTSDSVTQLLNDLESEDTPTRRGARTQLANQGQVVLADMANHLETKQGVYRAWYGVAFAMAKMETLVVHDLELAKKLTELLSSGQGDIRKNTVNAFGRLNDAKSRLTVLTALKEKGPKRFAPDLAKNMLEVFLRWGGFDQEKEVRTAFLELFLGMAIDPNLNIPEVRYVASELLRVSLLEGVPNAQVETVIAEVSPNGVVEMNAEVQVIDGRASLSISLGAELEFLSFRQGAFTCSSKQGDGSVFASSVTSAKPSELRVDVSGCPNRKGRLELQFGLR